MADDEQTDESNTFQILVATDCHLGYLENDAVRGNDSFISFEEILQHAKKLNVDFILLGGDLFHENKPSRFTLHNTMKLLRKYCMGNKPVEFEFMSDPTQNFYESPFPHANYEDPNLNIGIPIFSIHGNHDDPAGKGNLCALDIYSAAGLINHFGRYASLEEISISPVLLQKGETKLSLYGLGAVRDERLYRMFTSEKVTMLRPNVSTNDWFSLLVLHQNRAKHGPTNHVPEQFLDDFLDLIIWGHEHECKIDPEWNGKQDFYVSQPGSSVATSLAKGESVKKHIGLLKINKKEFKMTNIPLDTVRQFYIEDIILSDTSLNPDDKKVMDKVEAYCKEKVDFLLEKAENERSGNPRQPDKPLIRMNIDYTEFDTFNHIRFSQRYFDKVANPRDMIKFNRKRASKEALHADSDAAKFAFKLETAATARVEDMVKEYFAKADGQCQLMVLSETGMGNAVQQYVDKEENSAISCLVNHQLNKAQQKLKQRNIAAEEIDNEVVRFKDERAQNKEQEEAEVKKVLEESQSRRRSVKMDPDPDIGGDMDMDIDDIPKPTTSTRGRGRGRGSRGGTRGRKEPAKKGRGGKQKPLDFGAGDSADDDITVIDDSEEEVIPTKSKRSSTARGGRSKRIEISDSDDDDLFSNTVKPANKRRR